jgi:transketolase
MDGHNWDDIHHTILAARAVRGKPAMILAHTIKGKGNRAVDNRPESHNIKVPDQAAYEKYMGALEAQGIELPY